MAAITATERQELVALHLTMFGTAPTLLKLAQMVVAREEGKTFAQVSADLAADPAFAPVAARDAASFATWLADGLLASDIPAAARAWALNWVVTQLDVKSKAQIVAEAVQAIRATPNPNYTSSKVDLESDIAAALLTVGGGNPVDPQIHSLTAAATDIIKSGSADDIIIGQLGQKITLQASDDIDGGAGTDTFRLVTDGSDPQAASGFTVRNVEILEIHAQATGGTTLGLENVTGLTTIRPVQGNSALTLNNVNQLTTLDLRDGVAGQTVTVNYKPAVVAGADDIQKITVSGNVVDTLTVNGVETIAITTSTADSKVATVAGNALTAIAVAGNKALTFSTVLPASITTVDASAQTGGGITLTAAAVDLTVKGGAGNDRITFTGTLTTQDSFDGGGGRDTVIANVSEFTAASYAVATKIRNVEVIHFANVLTTAIDASQFTGEDTYVLGAGFIVPVTISKVSDGSTIEVRGTSTGTLTISVGDGATLATAPGTNNSLNLALGAVFGLNVDTIDVSGIETLGIASNGNVNDVGSGNIVTLLGQSLATLTVSGIEDLKLTLTGSSLTTLDASASSGTNDFTLVTYKGDSPATITGGSGVDKIRGSAANDIINGNAGNDVLAGAGGADLLTGGAGNDSFYFNATGDSSGTTRDTIVDFVSGSDLINIQDMATQLGRGTIVVKSGAAPNLAAAQASISANSGTTQVVFQADTNTLWVDANDDGQLDSSDLAVKLQGVTQIATSDIGSSVRPDGFGNLITITGDNATINATTATNANLFTTTSDDTVWATLSQASSIVSLDGLAGADTLKLTEAGAVTISSGVKNVETITLATVGTTANTLSINATGVASVVGSANADTLTTTNMVGATGASIMLGGGADTLTLSATLNGTAMDMGADDDTLNIGAGVAVTSTLAGGSGNDTLTLASGASISGASISGFETLNAAAVTTDLTLTSSQGFTSIKFGSGNDTITSVAASTSAVAFELGGGNDTVGTLIIGGGDVTLDFGAGNATVTNIAAHGGSKLILKFAATPGVASTVAINGTEANFLVGDLLDFAASATAVVNGKADGSAGSAGGAGQVFFDTTTNAANTIITFDTDGSRSFNAGDIQITVVGNVLAGAVDINGNVSITAST